MILLILAVTCYAQETVTIDLSADKGPVTYRASGFLHAMSATVPPPSVVDPLKPKLFRMAAEDWHKIGAGAFANYQRVKALGARMQIVVSDSHGYSRAGWWPGDNGDWAQWEAVVERLVRQAQEKGYSVEWDIWNEPNGGYFWKRDQAQFFDAWAHGYRKIRSLDPKAVIVGPSLSSYDRKYLESFLVYAQSNHVLPDVLAWHEFGDPRQIPAHSDEMRKFMAQQDIKIERICLNEIINSKQSLNPGVTAIYFANIERAQIDGACHACWGDKEGTSACENQSLDGILTPDKQPRSAWWAYKGYADITGRLVEVRPSASVDGVASLDVRSKTVRVILGRDGGTSGSVEMLINGLKSQKMHILAQRIPASGWDALAKPETKLDEDYVVTGGRLKVGLPDFGPSDAYVITLRSGK